MLLLSSIKRLALPLMLSIVFTACADKAKGIYDDKSTEDTVELRFEAELQPYFDAYVADAAAAGVAVPEQTLREFRGLMWADRLDLNSSQESKILGHCERKGLDSADESQRLRFVELLRPNAEGKIRNTVVDDITLKVMIYHELGHCLHDFDGHTNGKSAAIMNSSMQPARYFDPEGLVRDHFLMLKRMQTDPSYRP